MWQQITNTDFNDFNTSDKKLYPSVLRIESDSSLPPRNIYFLAVAHSVKMGDEKRIF